MPNDGFYSKRLAEERNDWRQHPMTKLAFVLLREQQAEAARVALEMPANADHTHVVANISYHKAIRDVIQLLETEG